MRINDFDTKHDEFKKVILNHDLTEEQLDEILPLVGLAGMAAGTVARGAAMAGGALARTAGGAVARGAGALARGAARGIGKAASAVGRGANKLAAKAGQAGKTIGKQAVQKGQQSVGKALKQKFSQAAQNAGGGGGGSQGTQGTQGTTQQQQQANTPMDPNASVGVSVGSEFELPDPTNPRKTISHVVKKVGSQDIELEPKQKKPGIPTNVKFAKKDITG